jgi:hypothetical protein
VGTTFLDYVEEPWSLSAGNTLPAVPFADASTIARFALTGNPGGDETPTWAPNGDFVAFTRPTGGNRDIWVVRPDGMDLRPLTTAAGGELHPSWQPGSTSEADKVDGHTHPGPVARGDSGDNSNDSGPQEQQRPARTSPGLSIRRARWRGRRVSVLGRSVAGLAGRLRVRFRCGGGARRRTDALVLSSRGQFRATLRTKRACRRVRRGVIVATYGGDAHYTAQRVGRPVRRR